MKKLLVLLAPLALAARPTLAQMPASAGPAAVAAPTRSPDQQADRRAQYYAKQLGLTADQQTRLEPILLAQRQELLALRDKMPADGRRRGMGQGLKAAQAKYNDQIKAVLTPEQFTKFEQMRDEQRANMRERRQGGQAQ